MVKNKILIYICSLIVLIANSGFSQQIIDFSAKGVENKCYVYNLKSDSVFKESLNIVKLSDDSINNATSFYMLSKPIAINQKADKSESSFAFVLKGRNLERINPLFFISISDDGEIFQKADLLDEEIITDTTIYGNLYFFNQKAKFFKFFVSFDNKSDANYLEEIKFSIISDKEGSDIINSSVKNTESIMPAYISRTDWACADGQNSPLWTPQYTNVTHLVVHHTAGSNNILQNYAATVRSIWSQHTYTNSWGDIGYNYLIDAYGKIYEGRAGGNNVIGAHCGFNSGTMGLSIMGTYTSELPSDTSLGSLIAMLAWKCNDSKIDPFNILYHVSSGKTINTICGHRDVKSTECPGNAFYAKLEDIRSEVNILMQTSAITKNNIRIYPSPVKETLTLDIVHINWKNFTVEISDMYGRVIKNEDFSGFEGGKIYLNLFNFKSGIYYLRILSISDILFSEKLIKI